MSSDERMPTYSQGQYDPGKYTERGPNRWLTLLGGGALTWMGLARRSLLGLLMAAGGGYLIYRTVSGRDPLGRMWRPAQVGNGNGHAINIVEAVTINRPANEVYRFWRNLENLPRFMEHLQSVERMGGGRSHWVATPLFGTRLEWDAEIVEEREPNRIAWRSLPGSEVSTQGSVDFRPLPEGRGVEVKATVQYNPPGGAAGQAVARLLNSITAQQVKEDLRRFKQLMETGEVATLQGQTSGRATLDRPTAAG